MNKMHLSRLIGQHEFWLGLLVVALAVGLSISTDEFLSLGNLTDVATSYAILGIGLWAVCGADFRRDRHLISGDDRDSPVCNGQLGYRSRR